MTYLQPAVISPPIYGQALNRFVQQWMAGVIGAGNLDPTLIVPTVQDPPPVIPNSGEAWMAFRVAIEKADTYPHIRTLSDGSGSVLYRHELISVLCSFYDTGTSGQAATLMALLRDGIAIPNNLETLTLSDFGMAWTEDSVVIPTLLSERWLYRVDLPFYLRRQVSRLYAVPNIGSAVGTLNTDTGLPPVPILAEEEE